MVGILCGSPNQKSVEHFKVYVQPNSFFLGYSREGLNPSSFYCYLGLRYRNVSPFTVPVTPVSPEVWESLQQGNRQQKVFHLRFLLQLSEGLDTGKQRATKQKKK